MRATRSWISFSFEEEGVDGTKLLQLTDKQLRIDLQIPSRTHRQKIMASIMELKHRQAVVQSESLDGRSRSRKMPKHYEAMQDEANVQPLILLLQDRHQINMQEAPPAALAAPIPLGPANALAGDALADLAAPHRTGRRAGDVRWTGWRLDRL